jgi:hypothetical protein
MRAEEAVGQRLVFAQQSEQKMFRFDRWRAQLAGFVPREEDHAPGFFRIPLEHDQLLSNSSAPGCSKGVFARRNAQGLKPNTHFAQLAARVNSCPDTKLVAKRVFRSP